jgi:transcriptional regulator with XRE-family HTH domain
MRRIWRGFTMSTSAAPSPAPAAAGFPLLLKDWRRRRRLSQFDLSLTSGVTQRHLSFLESGRAKPSRTMVLQLSDALEVPLRERNDWLLAAGFAPVFRARELDDPQMAQVLFAVRRMLANHEPFPALAVDRAWNIRVANRPFDLLAGLIGADIWTRIGGPERNLVRLLFHPEGLRPFVANWTSIAPLLWHRARREADAVGGEELKRVLAELGPVQDADALGSADGVALVPVLPLILEKDGVRLSMFTVISTFGTAQDVTTDEMRIESFFPSDEETEAVLRAIAGS